MQVCLPKFPYKPIGAVPKSLFRPKAGAKHPLWAPPVHREAQLCLQPIQWVKSIQVASTFSASCQGAFRVREALGRPWSPQLARRAPKPAPEMVRETSTISLNTHQAAISQQTPDASSEMVPEAPKLAKKGTKTPKLVFDNLNGNVGQNSGQNSETQPQTGRRAQKPAQKWSERAPKPRPHQKWSGRPPNQPQTAPNISESNKTNPEIAPKPAPTKPAKAPNWFWTKQNRNSGKNSGQNFLGPKPYTISIYPIP